MYQKDNKPEYIFYVYYISNMDSKHRSITWKEIQSTYGEQPYFVEKCKRKPHSLCQVDKEPHVSLSSKPESREVFSMTREK